MTTDLLTENARLRAALVEAKREIRDYLQDGSGTLAIEMAIEAIDTTLSTPAPDAPARASRLGISPGKLPALPLSPNRPTGCGSLGLSRWQKPVVRHKKSRLGPGIALKPRCRISPPQRIGAGLSWERNRATRLHTRRTRLYKCGNIKAISMRYK